MTCPREEKSMTGGRLSPSRRAVLTGVASAAAWPCAGWTADAPTPIARTRHGPVRGYRDKGIAVFKGVRYGQDTGPRRFLPPLAAKPWTEVLDATAYGPACPQRGREGPTSEDC